MTISFKIFFKRIPNPIDFIFYRPSANNLGSASVFEFNLDHARYNLRLPFTCIAPANV